MSRALRCFFTWLLLLALPLHGYAALTMSLCAAGHLSSVTAASTGHDHSAHAAAHPTAGDDSHAAKPVGVDGKCSACAACCTAVYLPTSVTDFAAPALSPVRAVPVPTAQVGFVTDGPERPPRHLAP